MRHGATDLDKVPDGEGWLHELKFDGYRLLCMIHDGDVRLMTRRGKDWTRTTLNSVRVKLAGLWSKMLALLWPGC